MNVPKHVYTKLLCRATLACVCACVGGCALVHLRVHPYFILRDTRILLGQVPVAVVSLGGMILAMFKFSPVKMMIY